MGPKKGRKKHKEQGTSLPITHDRRRNGRRVLSLCHQRAQSDIGCFLSAIFLIATGNHMELPRSHNSRHNKTDDRPGQTGSEYKWQENDICCSFRGYVEFCLAEIIGTTPLPKNPELSTKTDSGQIHLNFVTVL